MDNEIQGLHKIAQKWRSTPPLRELYFQFSMSDIRKNKTFLDLEFHHKIIVKHLANAFPNLNVFSLIHFVHWRKDYCLGFWVPYVPVEYRIELRALFRKGSLPKFQDFDGCLGTILSSWPANNPDTSGTLVFHLVYYPLIVFVLQCHRFCCNDYANHFLPVEYLGVSTSHSNFIYQQSHKWCLFRRFWYPVFTLWYGILF